MRRSVLSLLLSLTCFACSPASKCPKTDDLSQGWFLESMNPKNTIVLDEECPQTVVMSLGSKDDAVYAARISTVEKNKPITLYGTFISQCEVADGLESLVIFENGVKVAVQESKLSLASRKLRVDYLTVSNEVTYMSAVQANLPCRVYLQMTVAQ